MGFNERIVFNDQSTAITIDGVVAGADATGSPVLRMNRVKRESDSLAAQVTVDAETDTVTLTAVWQGSNDNSTFFDIVQPNSAAYVIMATGTAGADAAITHIISAPIGAYSVRFVRVIIRVGVVDGTAVDSANVGYNYELDDLV